MPKSVVFQLQVIRIEWVLDRPQAPVSPAADTSAARQ
jgi:hypothetical protein